MKISTITSNLVMLSLGALVSACGSAEMSTSDQPGLESSDTTAAADVLGEQKEALTPCDDPQYDHWRYLSSLAVSAGNELGRWNLTDFTWSDSTGLAVSSTARCLNGCQNTKAILELQNYGTGIIPRHDANLFKNYLKTYYQDQTNWNNANGVSNHVLVPTTVTTATCGYRYWYRNTVPRYNGTAPIKSALSNKCFDTTSSAAGALVVQMSCDSTNEQNIVISPNTTAAGGYRLKNAASGLCLRPTALSAGAALEQRPCGSTNDQDFDIVDNMGKLMLKTKTNSQLCVSVASASTSDGAQIRLATCNIWYSHHQFLTSAPIQNVDNPNTAGIKESLRFVGIAANPYLQFQSTATEVSIDPMGSMVDGGSSGQSGSCIEAASVYDSSRTSGGKCCVVSGRYGTLQASAWNPSMFYCK